MTIVNLAKVLIIRFYNKVKTCFIFIYGRGILTSHLTKVTV